MARSNLKSDLLLLVTAAIWGVAFVAQRVGMDFVGPFTFGGIRFALGALVLLPFAWKSSAGRRYGEGGRASWRQHMAGGILAGSLLFGGASLQQMGLVYTTAGNAGFITGLYVVLVPIIGLAIGRKTNAGTWTGALMAAAGLYLLCVTDDFSIARGDLLVMISAFLWAGHVLLIDRLVQGARALVLAAIQFAVCSALSLATAVMIEDITWDGICSASWAIAYGGVMSVGVAYTLQVVAQKDAHPAHAAIFLSLEAVFAVISGWVILGESMSFKALCGCGLMLAGMLVSQLYGMLLRRNRAGA